MPKKPKQRPAGQLRSMTDIARELGVAVSTVKRAADRAGVEPNEVVGTIRRFAPDRVAAIRAAMTRSNT